MDDPMLTAVKLAMAITVTDYDAELYDLIAASKWTRWRRHPTRCCFRL